MTFVVIILAVVIFYVAVRFSYRYKKEVTKLAYQMVKDAFEKKGKQIIEIVPAEDTLDVPFDMYKFRFAFSTYGSYNMEYFFKVTYKESEYVMAECYVHLEFLFKKNVTYEEKAPLVV